MEAEQEIVYIIMGINAEENDQVLAISRTYEQAKEFCKQFPFDHEYFDLWIDKHVLM